MNPFALLTPLFFAFELWQLYVGERYLVPGVNGEANATSQLLELRDQLRRAVENENFELAAELRDQIRVLE